MTIDQLWVEASDGHFGFSVQKKIWEECSVPSSSGDQFSNFCDHVGWGIDGYRVKHSDFKFSSSQSLPGELPDWYQWLDTGNDFNFLLKQLVSHNT